MHNRTPLETVKGFYRYDWSRSRIFNRRNLDARKRWLSPSLYRLFLSELEKERQQKERQHLKKYPTDKPFFGDGFLFQPMGEYFEANGKPCRITYRIGKQVARKKEASISVIFFYLPTECENQSIYKIRLERGPNGWGINDIIYSDGSSLVADIKKHQY